MRRPEVVEGPIQRIFHGARHIQKIETSWTGLRAEVNTMDMQAPTRTDLCMPDHTLLSVIQGGVRSVTVKADGAPDWQGPKLAGSAGFFPASRPMIGHWPAATRLTYFAFFIGPSATQDLLECSMTRVSWRTRPEAGDPFFSAGLARLTQVLNRERVDPLAGLQAETLATMMHLHVVERFSNLRGLEAGFDDDGIEHVLELIQDELPHAVPLARMVAVSGLPRGRFLIAFRQRTGTSPHQFILHERLARARALLESTNQSVGEIALRVGCANAGHLGQLFRQHFRMTPRSWRDLRGRS